MTDLVGGGRPALGYEMVKRATDILGATAGLVVLSPVLALVALAVRVQLGSPVLFRQVRAGRFGRAFTIVKFRTMRDGAGSDEERLTGFGRALRSTSLDELPELVNVLRGEMSLVGPRPLLTEYIPRYSERQARRHEVRPGLTGLAQVGGRNLVSWDDRLELDVEYVDSRSLRLDISIILRTLAAVVQRRGIAGDGHATMAPFTGTDDSPQQESEDDGPMRP